MGPHQSVAGRAVAVAGLLPVVGWLGRGVELGADVVRGLAAARTVEGVTSGVQAVDAGADAYASIRLVYRSAKEGSDLGSSSQHISLDQARAAAVRNGIDTRMFDFSLEPNHPEYGFDQYGSMAYDINFNLLRNPAGRFQMTLSGIGLRDELTAVQTIAHELKHVRGTLRGGFAEEDIAESNTDVIAQYFRLR